MNQTQQMDKKSKFTYSLDRRSKLFGCPGDFKPKARRMTNN